MRTKQTFEIEYDSPYEENAEEDNKAWLCPENLLLLLTQMNKHNEPNYSVKLIE